MTCVFNPIQVTLQNHFSLPLFFQYGTMEAVVPLKWIKKHRASLIEDRVYRLRYLEIIDARNSHRAIPHPFMARLTGHTKIVEVTEVPQSFPLYACSVTPFATLRARSDDRDDMSGTFHSAFFYPCLFQSSSGWYDTIL